MSAYVHGTSSRKEVAAFPYVLCDGTYVQAGVELSQRARVVLVEPGDEVGTGNDRHTRPARVDKGIGAVSLVSEPGEGIWSASAHAPTRCALAASSCARNAASPDGYLSSGALPAPIRRRATAVDQRPGHVADPRQEPWQAFVVQPMYLSNITSTARA